MSEGATAEPLGPETVRAGFFTPRWRGEVPLSRLFWRDMALVATIINGATTIAAVLMLGLKAPALVALAVHFAPLPYNLFLFLAIWRTAEKTIPAMAWAPQLGAAAWLILATVV